MIYYDVVLIGEVKLTVKVFQMTNTLVRTKDYDMAETVDRLCKPYDYSFDRKNRPESVRIYWDPDETYVGNDYVIQDCCGYYKLYKFDR